MLGDETPKTLMDRVPLVKVQKSDTVTRRRRSNSHSEEAVPRHRSNSNDIDFRNIDLSEIDVRALLLENARLRAEVEELRRCKSELKNQYASALTKYWS